MPTPGEDYQAWSTIANNNGTIDPLVDWHEGEPRAQVNDSSRSELAAHAKNRNLLNGSIVTTGTKNAQAFLSGVNYTITIPTGLRATLLVGAGLTNDAALTLNMDSMGAVAVMRPDGTAASSGEFVGGHYVDILYNGTFWIYLYSAGNFAPINNPFLQGDPKAPTAPPLDADNSIATTAFVQNAIFGSVGIVLSQRVFSTPGIASYIPHPMMKACLAECIGGGGAGGGGDGAAGVNFGFAGGGSGSYSRKLLTGTDIGASQVIAVGAGGVASAATGGNGGDSFIGSSFNTCLCGAHGGIGGSGREGLTAGAGGAAGVGDITAAGEPGDAGRTSNSGGNEQLTGGNGGSGIFGGGGVTPWIGGNQGITGGPGRTYGAGGGGALADNWAAPAVGGPGAPGVVIITEFSGAGATGPAGATGATGPTGPSGPGTGDVLRSGTPSAGQWAVWTDGSHIQGVAAPTSALPTVQIFTAGSGTYTKPGSARWLRVRLVGGGGGGAGGAGNGSTGGNTTFGAAFLTGGGGGGGLSSSAQSAGGTASGGHTNISGTGGAGGTAAVAATINGVGGTGGHTPFGGGAAGGYGQTGVTAPANSGGGGSGGAALAANTIASAGGGGGGGYVEAIITSPAATYAYAVGISGTGAGSSVAVTAGGNGATGIIIVEEYY